jgi:hypothetical protein
MKYLQKTAFVITGEGTKQANEKYRENYERIFGKGKK